MKKGDILKIKGTFGFLRNPEMIVIDIKNTLVQLAPLNSNTDGLLGHLNTSWHGIEEIKKHL